MKRWRRTTGLVLAGLILIALAVQGVSFRHDLSLVGVGHDAGFAYNTKLNLPWHLKLEGDSGKNPAISALRLFEDGRELGPTHVLHAEIRSMGSGRYSHWQDALWFSASDNSDPRSNGRLYTLGYDLALPVPLGWGLAGVVLGLTLLLRSPWGRRTTPDDRPVSRASVLIFILIFVATWGGCLLAYSQWEAGNQLAPNARELQARLHDYLKAPERYNLLFMGDSKSYCDIHPELIDPIMGSRSVGLSHFTHWFPTQYSMVRDMVDAIPKGTVVVWSLGHVNVAPSVGMGVVYPVGWGNAFRFLAWDVPRRGMIKNLMSFTPALTLFLQRPHIRKSLAAWMGQPLRNPVRLLLGEAKAAPLPEPTLAPNTPQADWQRLLQRQYGQDPRVMSFETTNQNGRLNSVVLNMRGGSYYRIEIDPAFFRAKQAEGAERPISETKAASYPVALNEGYLRLLDETLELYRQAGLRVIVNELEEAPHRYAHPLVREKWRRLMRDVVKPRVEAKGFAYIWTDLDRLSDVDYFDYNHMNSQGIAKYTPMLAAKLQEAMRAKGWELR